MTPFTQLPPGFAFFSAILLYDFILLLHGELTFVSVDHFYETGILEGALEPVERYHETLSESEVNPGDNGFEMDSSTTGGETGWDLFFSWDFPDFS